jgi:osmoprotectant transport system permease protein
MNIFQFMWTARAEIFQLSMEHVFLVIAAIAIAIFTGVPLGILMTRRPRLGKPVLMFANIVQTIPSLALFGFLIPVPFIGGIGVRTAIIVLFFTRFCQSFETPTLEYLAWILRSGRRQKEWA